MDDFLLKLYNEELEKNAGAGREALFHQLPTSDLEAFLGLEKVAVGGKPEGPDVPPEFEKAFKAREAKGRDAQKQMATAYSKSETTPDRNIQPFKAGETTPDRNINPQAPQVSSSAASLPVSTVTPRYEGTSEKSAEANLQWADRMGRTLAHMQKEGSSPFGGEKLAAAPENWVQDIAAHVKKNAAKYGKATLSKGSCAMGKAAAVSLGIKIASQLPDGMRAAVIETTASEMRKVALSKELLTRAATKARDRVAHLGSIPVTHGPALDAVMKMRGTAYKQAGKFERALGGHGIGPLNP